MSTKNGTFAFDNFACASSESIAPQPSPTPRLDGNRARSRTRRDSLPRLEGAACGAKSPAELNKDASTPDKLLSIYGPKNVYMVFVWLIMAGVWGFTAMAMMVSAFLMEPPSCAVATTNETFANATTVACALDDGTMAKDFDLTGGRAILGAYTTSAFLIGDTVGSVFLPPISDKTGRRPILLLSMVFYGIFGIAAAAAPEIYSFIVLRFTQGFFFTGCGVTSWVLAYESIPLRLRAYTTLTFGLCWVAGYIIVAPMAYHIHSWRWLVFAVSLPCLVGGIFHYFTIPESFHYVVSHGRSIEVAKWIERANRFAAWTNSPRADAASADELCGALKRAECTPLDDSADDTSSSSARVETRKNLVQHLYSNRLLLIYLSVMIYLWTCDAFVYYGLSLFSTQLAGNSYLNFMLMGLIEIPSYLVSPLLLNRLGRRTFMSLLHFLAASSFFVVIVFDHPGMHLAMWLVAKFAVSCAFTSLFVYSSELFPTIVRNRCLGICSVVARLGSSFAPIVKALALISPIMPTLFFGICALVGGALTLILPETRNRELPDLPEEMS